MHQVLSKEELRKIEIGRRLQILKQSLPYLNQFYKIADDTRQNVMDEINNLENEREAINQGQLMLDY